jgi:CRP-like cAMP-binding protein
MSGQATTIHSYLEALMHAEDKPRVYDPGEVIFEAGERGAQMFVVRAGSVELRVDGETLETVGPGGMVGEMALIDAAPRSATAVAGLGCTLVPIDVDTFHKLVQGVPGFALEVMRIMAARLRRANTR